MQLRGKTALISGAGRNSGKAIALTFAREGADVILLARKRVEQLNEVARECESFGVRVLPVVADATNAEEVNAIVQRGLELFGKIDVLVNVVGYRSHKPFLEYSFEEWSLFFNVNCNSLFHLAKAVLPGMVERKTGSIIALGGQASMRGVGTAAPNASSKHAVYGLIKSLALEFGPYGIRANLLNPGNITNVRLNPEWYSMFNGEPGDEAELAQTPLGRLGTNQEVANVALFLASDQSSYITGDRILCMGGRLM
jgi:NAD(P)-dependent dehydrogenase (short-subunit alcohol dehydrogenase family)